MAEIVRIERQILKKNDEIAAENRNLFLENKLFVFNLLSSPGSGKTSLLEKTLEKMHEKHRIAVIEGDVQTDLDAQRISKYPVPVIQIVTKGGCHLEASLIQNALPNFKLNELDLLIIENVGNLVCPSNYDLGENTKVVVVSTTEGDDKPLKYPNMFRVADVMVINKIDLLPFVDFDLKTVKTNALSINPDLLIFETSCRTGEGIHEWVQWLEEQIQVKG
ncbi:MAG: hydrogenase nickel incorporation protein HypB [Calditrichia bacterium]